MSTLINRQDLKDRLMIPPDSSILVYAYFGIGNMVFFTPALALLRERFPLAKITLQVGNDTKSEGVVAGSGCVDEVVEFNVQNGFIKSVIYALRVRKKYDVIIAEFHSIFLCIVLQIALSEAKYKIGHVSGGGWKNEYDFLYNITAEFRDGDHEIYQHLRLIERLGIDVNWERDKKRTFVHCSAEAICEAICFLNDMGVSATENIICFQVGTSPTMRWKQWPIDNFRQVLRETVSIDGVRVVMVGAPIESGIIEETVNGIEKVLVAAGKLSLEGTNALIGRSALAVCNDSGLAKVAIAQGVPTITIWGPTDFQRVGTWLEGHVDLRSNLSCVPCFMMSGMEQVEACPRDYECLQTTIPKDVIEWISKLLKVSANQGDRKLKCA